MKKLFTKKSLPVLTKIPQASMYPPLGWGEFLAALVIFLAIVSLPFRSQAQSNPFLCQPDLLAKINTKWAQYPFLGAAKGTPAFILMKKTCVATYENGVVLATYEHGAFELHGSIWSKWKLLGGLNGFLGTPLTDESATPDGAGRYNHFENGSIYYFPCLGPFEVHGLIRNRWAQMGWERSALGYPKSDELTLADGQGKFTLFQHGAIYWHPSDNKTYVLTGDIFNQWKDQGADKGILKRPIGDVTCTPFTCIQKFVGGTLSSIKINRPVDLRSEINRRGITIANQSPRPTCSVHAMTFLLEWGYTELCGSRMKDLSEEYLNHMTNLASGRTNDGDFFSFIAAGFDKYGIVSEADMPYKTSYNFANVSASSELISRGQVFTRKGVKLNGHFIKPNDGSVGMTDSQYKEVFQWLLKGIPVAIGRSHSTVIVGYKYDATRGGGGQFIIRNSYGPNTDDHGYFYEDFDSVKKSVNDVYVYDWPKQ
ncbi:MAG: hypothetical protein RJB66_1098 [Pseudomonadota bacterium]|jgi:hypothetical protein